MSFAKYLKEADEEKEVTNLQDEIFNFFTNNEDPSDDEVHDFAESLGVDKHDLEGEIYKILSSFLSKGKYNEEGGGNVDRTQLDKGIQIEMEHTSNKKISERIAQDHLTEIPDYYDRLEKMESDYEKEVEED